MKKQLKTSCGRYTEEEASYSTNKKVLEENWAELKEILNASLDKNEISISRITR